MKRKQTTTTGSRIATTRAPRLLSADHLEGTVGGDGDIPPKRPNVYDDGSSTKRPL